MKKKVKVENKGITLVALVVTIVVLLILAGVSINLVLGNNGIVNRAQESKSRTEYEQEIERVQYAVVGALDSQDASLQTSSLKAALKQEFGLTDAEINSKLVATANDGPWVYTGKTAQYNIDKMGSVSKK